MESEFQRAQKARVPYLLPRSLSDYDGRAMRTPSPVPLHESYETQVHVGGEAGARHVVRSGRLLPPPRAGSFEPILFQLVSAWNPHGVPSTLTENLAHSVELANAVADAGGEVRDVCATMPPNRAWVEDSLVVRGLAPRVLVELAKNFGQPAVSLIGMDSITIAPTGLTDEVHLVTLEYDEVPLGTTCPMRTDELPGARCARHGGPWISASQIASGIWDTHRQLLLDRLGCVPCDNGSRPTLGPFGKPGPPTCGCHVRLASRYGGYVWGTPRD